MNDLAFYYPEGHENHSQYGHPERPERVEVIRNSLKEDGLWDQYHFFDPDPVNQEVLESIHNPHYLAELKKRSKRGLGLDMETYLTEASWELAMNAVGGAIAVAKSVWDRESKRGFALTRPPGHHATSNRGMGFCLLNNIAVAAEQLLQEEGAIRLAIIDFDLHHGNGTQEIFWTREDVLYISTHQYPHYPGTGNLRDIGDGRGKGATANFPLPPMSGDEAYMRVLEDVIIPLINKYKPEMLLISYGFDIHWRDPLGQMLVSAKGYGNLIDRLSNWADQNCQGRIALFLEGGYDLDAAVACSRSVISALLGQTWEDSIGSSPYPETNSFQSILKQTRVLWGLDEFG